MKVTKYVQNTFVLDSNGKRILIDPGKYNVDKGFDAQAFGRVDGIIITHNHADHFDLELTKSIVSLYSPSVLAAEDVARTLREAGISSDIGVPGAQTQLAGYDLHLTATDHVVNGVLIVNFGMLVSDGACTLFHTSDTRFLGPDQLQCDRCMKPDVLLVPISNRGLVMGFEDALYFCSLLAPRIVVPMHYDSPKDASRVKPEHFKARAEELVDVLPPLGACSIRILSHGASLEVGRK